MNPIEAAWAVLKAWPDPPEEGEKERLPVSHLPLQHPARKRHRGQAARTGGIEGLEGTMPPEFGSDIGEASGDYGRLPGKKEMRPELEPFERDEALASEGAEMPDPSLSQPDEELPEPGLEAAWREITGSGGTAADELGEHLRPDEEKEQQAQEGESQLNEMARQMGEKAGDYFTESAERSEPITYANMSIDELKNAYIPLIQRFDSMSDEEREADPDFMEDLERVRQALRSAEWEEGQNKPATTQSARIRPTRGGRRGGVRVQPQRGAPRRGE